MKIILDLSQQVRCCYTWQLEQYDIVFRYKTLNFIHEKINIASLIKPFHVADVIEDFLDDSN